MESRLSVMTLGVVDLGRPIRFDEQALCLPRLASPPSIAFFALGRTWLARYPRERLATDAGISPAGSGFAGSTLAHYVRSAAAVDERLDQVAAAGGPIVRVASPADWGGYSGAFADPDVLWEVAWSAHFPHV